MEAIKPGAHVQRIVREAYARRQETGAQRSFRCISRLGRHRQGHNGQINRTAPAVGGMTGDIAVAKEISFVDCGVKFLFSPGIIYILRPAYKVVNRTLGPVTVINF